MEADERSSIRLARERLRLDTATAQRRQMAEAELRGMLQQGKAGMEMERGGGSCIFFPSSPPTREKREGRKWMGLFGFMICNYI